MAGPERRSHRPSRLTARTGASAEAQRIHARLCGRRRCHCDSKLARPCTPGYDQPLRPSKSEDEAESPRADRSQVAIGQGTALEAGCRFAGMARFAVNAIIWPSTRNRRSIIGKVGLCSCCCHGTRSRPFPLPRSYIPLSWAVFENSRSSPRNECRWPAGRLRAKGSHCCG